MLNYKECSIDDFNEAMKNKNMDVKSISDEHLYILYTKFKADASACFYAGTSYARTLGAFSEKQAQSYKEELQNREINVLWGNETIVWTAYKPI